MRGSLCASFPRMNSPDIRPTYFAERRGGSSRNFMSCLHEMNARALEHGVPLSVALST